MTCFLGELQAQIVSIPDPDFKIKLVALGIDTNQDGNIQQTEAAAVTTLDVSYASISSLVGLQAFVNLEHFNCYGNQLTALDMSIFPNLQTLDCSGNQLTSLVVTNLSNLTELKCYNNQLATLDLTGLSSLLTLDFGINLISTINFNNCPNVVELGCYNNQFASLDVTMLANLQKLNCMNNVITSLNVNNLANLTELNCENNQLAILTLTGLPSLQKLSCPINLLTNFDATNLSSLTELDCSNNLLTNLNVLGLANLTVLKCNLNQIVSINLSNCPSLMFLTCDNNYFSTLNVSSLTNLAELSCMDNQLTSLDVSNLSNLSVLSCSHNQISNLILTNCINLSNIHAEWNEINSLNLNGLSNLDILFAHNNNLSTLNINGLSNLQRLYCDVNQLTNLSIINCPNMKRLYCSQNQLSSLDVSTMLLLDELHCSNNPIQTISLENNINMNYFTCMNSSLVSLYIKNGKSESVYLTGNPNLQYICADANSINYLNNYLATNNMSNVVVNSFCTFAFGTGASVNTVEGVGRYDADANGCSPTDMAYPYLQINATDGTNTAHYYTDNTGNYSAYVNAGNYTFSPQLQNPTYFSVTPNSANINFTTLNNVQTQDYCITANGSFADMEVVLMPVGPARPGFDADYQLIIRNKGTVAFSGDVSLDFMGNKMGFVSANVSPTSQNANQLVWSLANVQPFENREITLVMNLLPPPTNNGTDLLTFSATVSNPTDYTPLDNNFALVQTVVNAYDPNDKTCLQGEKLPTTEIGNYLYYLIRFQNTGNFYAEKVVVVDSLDASKFEVSSMQLLETSHAAKVKIENNVLQFHFEGIMLPDSFTNEPQSHGYALFKIRTKANLVANTTVKNSAQIYFDYNPPIFTNTSATTFLSGLQNESYSQNLHFQCYPNPVQHILTVEVDKRTRFVILNVLGEILMEKEIAGKENWDISSLLKGIYVIKQVGEANEMRFVKE